MHIFTILNLSITTLQLKIPLIPWFGMIKALMGEIPEVCGIPSLAAAYSVLCTWVSLGFSLYCSMSNTVLLPKMNSLLRCFEYRKFKENSGCHRRKQDVTVKHLPSLYPYPHCSPLFFQNEFLILKGMISFLSSKAWSSSGLLWQFLNKGGPLPKVILIFASKRIKFSQFNYVYYFKSSPKSCMLWPFLYLVQEEMETKGNEAPPQN